jgi:hypothetical protein
MREAPLTFPPSGLPMEHPHVVRCSVGLVIRPSPAYVSNRTIRTYTFTTHLSPPSR